MFKLTYTKGVHYHVVTQRPGSKQTINPETKRFRCFEPDSAQWWRKGIEPQRDSWKSKCYAAEEEMAKKVEQKVFANITEVAKYVRNFMEKPWFQRRFPHFTECHVEYRPGTTACRAASRSYTNHVDGNHNAIEVISGKIEMSNWGMGAKDHRGGEFVVLHELAHAVLPNYHMHDRRWLRTYMEFIGCAVGQQKQQIFMGILRSRKIPYSPFKQIKFTEQQIQRLAAVRPEPKAKK